MVQELIDNHNHDTDCEIKFFKAELPVILLMSTIANLAAVITQIRMLCSIRTKNLWLLVFLTGNDLFTSVILLTVIIINTITCGQFQHNILCDLMGWLGISSFGVSIFLVMIINVERFLMIVFPIFHHKHVTIFKMIVLFVIGECVSLILIGLPLVGIGSPYHYYEDNRFCAFDFSTWLSDDPIHAKLVLLNGLYTLLIVLLVIAANIATILRLQHRNNSFGAQMNVTQSMGNSINMAKKFSLLTKVVAFVNCICNVPFFIKLISDYVNYDKSLQGVDDTVTTMLLFLTPIVNPFLYLFFNKMYRQYLFSPLTQVFPCLKIYQNRVAPAQLQQTTTTTVVPGTSNVIQSSQV